MLTHMFRRGNCRQTWAEAAQGRGRMNNCMLEDVPDPLPAQANAVDGAWRDVLENHGAVYGTSVRWVRVPAVSSVPSAPSLYCGWAGRAVRGAINVTIMSVMMSMLFLLRAAYDTARRHSSVRLIRHLVPLDAFDWLGLFAAADKSCLLHMWPSARSTLHSCAQDAQPLRCTPSTPLITKAAVPADPRDPS